MNEKPTALVLFAGGGGSTLGLDRAGYETVSVDVEQHCIDTLDKNGFPYQMADLSTPAGRRYVVDLWEQVHQKEPPHTIWSSPPCQDFSKANRKKAAEREEEPPPLSARSNGFLWTLALVRRLKPQNVIIENVLGAPWKKWQETMRRFYPHVGLVSLDAVLYGVAQHRNRTFLLASRKPWGFSPPDRRPAGTDLADALPWTRKLLLAQQAGRSLPPGIAPPGILIYPPGIGGSKPQLLYRPAPTVTCQEVKGTRASASSGWRYNGGPDRLSDALFSAVRVRRPVVKDCLVIQGMPADYQLIGTSTEQYRMVGNMVPPQVAEALGKVFVKREE